MANDDRHISRGMAIVGFMALTNKKFCGQLLEDPNKAMQKVQKKYNLDPDEVQEVVSAVRASTHDLEPEVALGILEEWRKTGTWPPTEFWPIRFWPRFEKPSSKQ